MTASRLRLAGSLSIALVVDIVASFAVLLVAPTATPHAAADEPRATSFVRVRIDKVTPDVVTTSSEPVVTVSGVVTNIGDRPVRDLMVRLEHESAVISSAVLRTYLDDGADQFQTAADFVTVAEELQRGQEAGFTLVAPIRSTTKPSMAIDQPGIYPVLVNVNGTPDYGTPARLDNARFLLPVAGVPPAKSDAMDSAVAPDITKPVWITMLWPLADRPRLSPGAPGGTIPVRLVDDDLASSLAPGGRLDILLTAAETATGRDVDPDGAVSRALCLAVDPDLLVTVNAMTGGYIVSNSPDGPAQQPGTPTHPGTGQDAAVIWLNRLRALAHRMCVASLPYAQADLDALQRINDTELSTTATTSVGDIVDHILDVTSIRGVTMLPDSPLTNRVVDLLNDNNSTVAIAAAAFSAQDSTSGSLVDIDTEPRRLSPRVVVAPFDPAVGAALAAAGTDPIVPTYLDSSLNIRIVHDSDTARRQDALSSILWRALERDAAPRSQILVPPTSWHLQADDARVMLTTLSTVIRSGLAVARPLPTVIADALARTKLSDTVGSYTSARGRFNDDIIADIASQVGRLWGLTSALTADGRTGLTGVQYTAPLREDMLRALSQLEPPATRNGSAQQRLAVVSKTIKDLIGAVTIVNPGGSYTLATEHSPLPLALHNGLAVPIRVRLQVDAPPGMTVTDVSQIELPPGYLPLRVPIEVNFTQRVAVDVALQTPEGIQLGEPVRLLVHSNAYGKVLFEITLTAATILIVLAGRRLWHRFRIQTEGADSNRPDPLIVDAHPQHQYDDWVDEENRI